MSEYFNEDPMDAETIDYLIRSGAMELDGIDEDGESIFKFHMDILKQVMPELHEAMNEDLNEALLDLYKDGLIEVEYDEELNALIRLSEEAKEILLDYGLIDDEDIEEISSDDEN